MWKRKRTKHQLFLCLGKGNVIFIRNNKQRGKKIVMFVELTLTISIYNIFSGLFAIITPSFVSTIHQDYRRKDRTLILKVKLYSTFTNNRFKEKGDGLHKKSL